VNAFTVRIASLQQLEHRHFSSTLRPHPHPGVDAIISPIPITSHIWLTFFLWWRATDSYNTVHNESTITQNTTR